MKVAIVHDYIKEYGGAERVLEALCELYPDAPIYTAFYLRDSLAYERFKNKKIIASWVHYIPFFASKLHSPLRFLAPFIWGSFNFSEYDVVISSASWYVTKGFGGNKKPIEICYCHTPPRWLYGYKTSVEWQKYWPIKLYGTLIGHVMRLYDFRAAQRVDYFIANSKEVQARIKKFYRRDAVVIYPPVYLASSSIALASLRSGSSVQLGNQKRLSYYLVVARLVGAKGLELAIQAAVENGFHLKIVGAASGYYSKYKQLSEKAQKNVEFLGFVSDEELVRLYAGAKAFLALATDEDFGITPVEAMLCGTPIIAYDGGGYRETIVNGKTGIFFREATVASLVGAIDGLEKINIKPQDCIAQAQKFSKERFKKEIKQFVEKVTK